MATAFVVSAEGQTVKEIIPVNAGQSAVLDLTDLQPALYAIRAEGLQTIKVIKK